MGVWSDKQEGEEGCGKHYKLTTAKQGSSLPIFPFIIIVVVVFFGRLALGAALACLLCGSSCGAAAAAAAVVVGRVGSDGLHLR